MRTPMPPIAAVISFIDAINRGDVDRLAELMDPDHQLLVLDEPPLDGKEANVSAWWGYATSFPQYVICPQEIVDEGHGDVVVRGYTSGSHLDLPDEEERQLTVIWLATVDEGRLRRWQILEDNAARRAELGLAPK